MGDDAGDELLALGVTARRTVEVEHDVIAAAEARAADAAQPGCAPSHEPGNGEAVEVTEETEVVCATPAPLQCPFTPLSLSLCSPCALHSDDASRAAQKRVA
jgi:hypothetical protein